MAKLRFPGFFNAKPAAAPPVRPAADLLPRTEACRFIIDYWRRVRGDRLRPRDGEIDPAGLAKYLPHIALLEVRARDETYCRLAGTAIRLSLGFELTGKNVIHIYAPELHRAAGYRFWSMATHPCGAMFEMPLRFSTGLSIGVEAPHEVVVLPLEPDSPGAPPMLLLGAAGMAAVKWENTALLPQLDASPSFRFVDIGAGIPVSSLPPDDFGR